MSGVQRYEVLGLTEDHTPEECPGCERGCMFCEGGLWACKACHGLEGGMPTQCPGVGMTAEQSDAVYEGRLDYRSGGWREQVQSINSPGWYHSEEGLRLRDAIIAAENAAAAGRTS